MVVVALSVDTFWLQHHMIPTTAHASFNLPALSHMLPSHAVTPVPSRPRLQIFKNAVALGR